MCRWNLATILQDLVLAIVINTSAMLMTGAEFSFQSWYPGTCSAFGTNVILQLILPVPAVGQAISKPFAQSRWRFIVSLFIENLIFVTCISFTMALVQTGGAGVVDAWLATYARLVIVGYVTSLILYAIFSRGFCMGEAPKAA